MDSGSIAAKLAAYDANPVTTTSALNDALAQYGVPEIRNTVSGLRTTVANTTNSLNAVDPSVTGRTSGSLVTEAQRQRQVANERAPIAEQLGSQTGALGDAEKNLNDDVTQANQQATNKVNDYRAGRDALQSQYDTTYKREQDVAAAKAAADAAAEQRREFDSQQATTRGSSSYGGGSSSSSGAQVNPAKDFLNYISNQFKAAGKNPSRQSQDAWANAWFSQNGVSNANRQQYWNLFNSTYKRPDDPTKDYLYKR